MTLRREEALRILKDMSSSDNLLKHCLATEAIMRGLAKKLGEDVEKWGFTGLIHDLDYEQSTPETHGIITAEKLEKMGVSGEIIDAVKKHNYKIFSERKTPLEVALIAADSITGLIIACALVKGKKIENVMVNSVLKKFKDKSFARGAYRDGIREIEKLGLSLEEFMDIALMSMKGISRELGL